MGEGIAKPRRRSARSQSAILKAAYDLCQEEGYGQLTIEAIAARAGVGKQTIYRWWPSKGSLLLDVFIETILQRLQFDDTGDPLLDIRRRVAATAEVLADPTIGPHIAGLIGEAQHDRALADELRERLVEPARAQHRELLSAAQASGQLRKNLDIDLIADAVFAPIWFRLLVTHFPLSREYAEDAADVALSGCLGTAGRPRQKRSQERR